MNEKDIISPLTAYLAKQLGFNEETFYFYLLLKKEKLKEELFELVKPEYKDIYDLFTQPLRMYADYNSFTNLYGKVEYISAPFQSQLQKWLREKFNVYVTIEYKQCSGKFPYYRICLEDDEIVSIPFETYEEALEEGLYNALTILKNQ